MFLYHLHLRGKISLQLFSCKIYLHKFPNRGIPDNSDIFVPALFSSHFITKFFSIVLKYSCLFLLISYQSTAQTIQRYDIIIDEIFPDPSPSIGLPNNEFIELKNISGTAINLRNCAISDGSTTTIINTNYTLGPDSFVIVCPNSAVPEFAPYGPVIGVANFPSLNNDADVIALYAPNGALLHTVTYNIEWYQNAVKSDGGYTLEMIDPQNPCAGMQNWKASTHANGGTPGSLNSVNDEYPDDLPPALVRTYTIDSTTIIAVFDEPVDSLSAANTTNYSFTIMGAPLSVSPMVPATTEVLIKLSAPMTVRQTYQLTARNITDCATNMIGSLNTAKAGRPVMADSMDIVINELLFNPPANGADYIELYNRSNAVIDLKQLYLANRNATPISAIPWLLFPGEYITLTENKQWVQQQYMVNDPTVIRQCNTLPSMPDDKGDISLLNQQGQTIDALRYEEQWHFALIDNKEGIALERLNYNDKTQSKQNWSSAASTAGFGTPGFPNSQFLEAAQGKGQVAIAPAIFSPDNDGRNDFATIQLALPEPGYIANIAIFDAQGYRVRQLTHQATLAISGSFRWDGLGDKMNRLPVGNYIVLTELSNLQGRTKKYKSPVTLVRR